MRLVLTGVLTMITGVLLLFAMVIDVLQAGLFSSLGAYSLVIVGLVFSGVGLASVLGRERSGWRE